MAAPFLVVVRRGQNSIKKSDRGYRVYVSLGALIALGITIGSCNKRCYALESQDRALHTISNSEVSAETDGMKRKQGPKAIMAASLIDKNAPSNTLKAAKQAAVASFEEEQSHVVQQEQAGVKKAPHHSLATIEREVIHLEKQIQRHMAAREKSLDKIISKSTNCSTRDHHCDQTQTQIAWRASKNKYEEAALHEILSDRESSAQEGAALFKSYQSRVNSFRALNTKTSKLAHIHAVAEHQSLYALREAEKKLDEITMQEQKERDSQEAAQEKQAISETQKHLMTELAKMTDDTGPNSKILPKAQQAGVEPKSCLFGYPFASQPQKCSSPKILRTSLKYSIEKTRPASKIVPIPISLQTEGPYEPAFVDAKKNKAFRTRIESMRQKDQRENEHEIAELGDSSAYSRDLTQAQRIEQLRQAAQRHQRDLEREKSASEEFTIREFREDQETTVKKKQERQSPPNIKNKGWISDAWKTAQKISGDTNYRKDIEQALGRSQQRESRHQSNIIDARKRKALRDVAEQARAKEKVLNDLVSARSISNSDVIPADYSDLSSKPYDQSVAEAEARVLARTAKDNESRKQFFQNRAKILSHDNDGGNALFTNRQNEVAEIFSSRLQK